MPIYEYTCRKCESKFEKLVRNMSSEADGEKVACPSCGSKRTARSMSVFAVNSAAPKSSAPAPGMCGHCGGEPGACMRE